MKKHSIRELPDHPYKSVACVAEKLGLHLSQGIIDDPASVYLIGIFELIRELQERVGQLETRVEELEYLHKSPY